MEHVSYGSKHCIRLKGGWVREEEVAVALETRKRQFAVERGLENWR